MSKKVTVIWNTMEEKPNNEEEVIIATTEGYVTAAFYYLDGTFMNDFDQEWSEDEVEFWMPMLKHPTRA